MKTKIKVKVLVPGCEPEIIDKGDWIDLKAACAVDIPAPQAGVQFQRGNVKYRNVEIPTVYIPLGVAMQLPKGYEAIIASRSSGPKKIGVFTPSGQGIIDESYCGNTDEWNYVCAPMREVYINQFDKVCQFRIQLNQKATFWQKLKWLFSSGVELEFVDNLSNNARGGLGSTGI